MLCNRQRFCTSFSLFLDYSKKEEETEDDGEKTADEEDGSETEEDQKSKTGAEEGPEVSKESESED
jgi:chromatin remodeling complex protein RSC6